jgi:hypothetical protein
MEFAMPNNHRLSEVLLIAKDQSGEAQVINLSGLTIELAVPARGSCGEIEEIERRLVEARKGLEFYADAKNYQQQGGHISEVLNDGGDIARNTLKAFKG